MYEIHIKISIIPDFFSTCTYHILFDDLKLNLNPQIFFKNLSNDEITEVSLTTDLSHLLSGLSAHEYNKHYHNFVEPIESSIYPINCDCGIPYCAGIDNGIIISTNEHFVKWKAKRSNGYLNYLPAEMQFNKEQYLSIINNIRQQLIDLELSSPNQYIIAGDSIPQFFKNIANVQAILWSNKIKKQNFSVKFFADEKLNSYHLKNFKNLDDKSLYKKLHSICLTNLTNNIF